jgi:single-strand DNA-binding protein
MNVAIVRGTLSRPPEERVLPSGDRLVALEVTVPREGERAEGVPVVWPDAPESVLRLDVGDEVVAIGRVRRRFFRAGQATQSRTEVVADAVAPARQAKRARALVDRAVARVEEAASP